MLQDNKLVLQSAEPKDFKNICDLIQKSYANFDPKNIITDRHPIDLGNPPWIWYGDTELTWIIAKYKGEIVGFILCRNKKRNSHLHSLFIDPNVDSVDIVMELFDYHRKIIIEQNSKIDTITAHLAKNNVLARFSYKKTGFIEIDQNNVDITEESGLGDWIRNCIKFNDWPMREGRILVVKYIKQM